MIVKVLPRKGGSTRASARKLMAYLLGPGDRAEGADRVETGELGNRHSRADRGGQLGSDPHHELGPDVPGRRLVRSRGLVECPACPRPGHRR